MQCARSMTAMLAAVACVAVACMSRDEAVVEPQNHEAAPEQPSPLPAPALAPTDGEPTTEPAVEVSGALEDDAPSIAAYPPPRIENVFVRRSGPLVELIVRVARVRGARRYELQVAKTLMFEPLAGEASAPTRIVKLGPIAPGMFFVHARVVGAAGEGPFGDVRVVHAQKPGVAKIAALTAAEVESAVPEPPIVAGRPTAAAQAVAAPTVVAPAPAAPSRQPPSQSELTRLGPLRQRYEKLRKDLAEIEGVRREVQAKVAVLQAQLAGSNAKSAAALKDELATLEATRAELDREIAAGLAELDRMLATSDP